MKCALQRVCQSTSGELTEADVPEHENWVALDNKALGQLI